MDLLFKANFTKDNKFLINSNLVIQERGDVITSQTRLSEEWNWNIKTVKKFLEVLKKDGMITYETTRQYTRIFILNYDKFNPISKLYGERHTIQDDTQTEDTVCSEGLQGATINNDKNYKNEKNGKNIKETAPQSRAYKKEEVNEIFNILEAVNPMLERGNTTEREAAAALIRRLGFEKAKEAANAAVFVHDQPYAPQITTPLMLKKKTGDLFVFIKKAQNNTRCLNLDNINN
ncbi:hypothetical protein K8R32_03175 [bacterium]|nr:hypothetical protein [bacterium]